MTIKVKLGDKKTIQNAIKELKKYQKQLKSKINIFLTKVAEHGIAITNSYIQAYQIPEDVIGKVKIEKGDVIVSGGTIQIVVENDEALFWEYGTGLVGANNPHIDTNGWKYNVNNHKKGWVYKGDGTKYSWDVKGNSGLQFTKGMPSQPFMYSTFTRLQSDFSIILSIAREVFK